MGNDMLLEKVLHQVGRESRTPVVRLLGQQNGGGGTEDVRAELAMRTEFRPARGEPAVAHEGTSGGPRRNHQRHT
jgi:hypothetical protein